MYRIEFSPLAKSDLVSLKNHLVSNFDETIASVSMRELMDTISKFKSYPLIGRPLSNIIDIPTEYLYYATEKTYIFYRLENESIKIIRVLDTRQDYIGILFDEQSDNHIL